MKQRTLSMLTLLCFLCIGWGWSLEVEAKPRYTKAQLDQIVAKARAEAIKKRLERSKRIREWTKKKKAHSASLKRERCKVSPSKVPGLRGKFCVRFEGGKTKIYRNGKFLPVLTAAMNALAGIKKFVGNAKKELKKVGQDIKDLEKKISHRAKELKKDAGQLFDREFAKFKVTAKKKVDELVKKNYHKIIIKIATTMKDKWPEAKRLGKTKLQDKLKTLLRNKNRDAIKGTMQVSRTGAQAAKLYAKTAAISIAVSTVFTAAFSIYNCWKFDGVKKSNCLKSDLAVGLRDLLFTTVSSLVLIAVDLAVIEPMSHSIAGSASAALAAASAGVGAAAYPFIYITTSVAVNAAAYGAVELKLRPEYNKMIQPMTGEFQSASNSIVGAVPSSWMKCWAPNANLRKQWCENP